MEQNPFHDERRYSVALVVRIVLLSILANLIVLWLFFEYAPPEMRTRFISSEAPAHAIALEPIQPESGESIPDVVARVTPAVVSIVIKADVPVIERYYQEFRPFDFFDGFGFQIPRQRTLGTEEREIGGGSGFFVSPDGYIVTNRHVVDLEDARFSITTHDGTSYEAKVIAKDPTLDIAILKVNGEGPFPYLAFGDDRSVRLGSTVIAVGNALAEFPNSVSVGVISGLSRNIVAGDLFGFTESLEGVIQTDAAINHGNSGGPLLNVSGEVIGVNVAVAGNSENIGFALPVSQVRNVYESVREHGEIVRPFVGIRYITVTDHIKELHDLPIDYGILIVRGPEDEPGIIPDSPADDAGLAEDDIILSVNGEKLTSDRSFAQMIRDFSIGETIALEVLTAEGDERTVEVTLQRAPNET